MVDARGASESENRRLGSIASPRRWGFPHKSADWKLRHSSLSPR